MASLTAANFTFAPAAEPPAVTKAAAVMNSLALTLEPIDALAFAGHGEFRWLHEFHDGPIYS